MVQKSSKALAEASDDAADDPSSQTDKQPDSTRSTALEEHGHVHPHESPHGEPSLEQAAFYSLFYRIFRENNELRNAYETLLGQTIKSLLFCLEERDAYTYGHSMRVMEYAMMVGRGASLKESELRNLELSSVFHDLGKIGVPDCVLLKPARLDPPEQKVMERHPVKSAAILSLIDAFANVVPGVRHHHERVDGKGYPAALSGTQIPIISRIILVADTFDAMTSTRPYRKALPIDIAYAELERFAGSQFDSDVVKIFLREHQKLLEKKQLIVPEKKAA